MPENGIGNAKKPIEMIRYDIPCRELLRFLSMHPYTRFNQPALLNLLGFENITKIDIALGYLVKTGFIETSQAGGLFWLTRNESIHNMLISEFDLGDTPISPVTCAQMTQLVMPLIPCPM